MDVLSYLISIEEDIATFTIDRPEMRNAVNTEVVDGLESFLDRVENNPAVSFVVITGSGDRAFCSGGDLSEYQDLRTADRGVPNAKSNGRASPPSCNASNTSYCACERGGCWRRL